MQLVWSLIVAWAMVASAAPRGPRDHAHRTGISAAPAFHHPLRQRELPVVLGPFLAPDRTELLAPPATALVRSVRRTSIVLERNESIARARAPPVA